MSDVERGGEGVAGSGQEERRKCGPHVRSVRRLRFLDGRRSVSIKADHRAAPRLLAAND